MRIFWLCCFASCGLFPSVFEPRCLRDLDCDAEAFCQQELARCMPRELCGSGLDEDLDGLTDCEDLLDCFAAPGCATPGHVTALPLGEVSPGQEVLFPIPEGAAGFTIIATGSEDNVLGIRRLVAPDGEVRVSGFEDQQLRQFNAYEAFGFVVPQGDSDQNLVTPGSWRLTLGAAVVEPLEVEVLVRLGPLSEGAFALNVYLPEGLRMCGGVSCEGGAGAPIAPDEAEGSVEMSGLLHTLSEVLQPQLGISIGEINFYSLDEAFLFISSQDELAAMFQQSVSPGGLNVFLVQAFSASDFPVTLAGVSSGIPGAVGTSGNKNSGVAIKVALDPELSDNINGMVVAHELGHFLGLWHTTEFNGAADLLSDTPACPAETISTDPSLCPDFHHIMFPSLSGSEGVFSETQQSILRAGVGYR